MSTPGISQPAHKQVILDGIKYNIHVTSLSGGMFRAEWKCAACSEDGAWAPISADSQQAIDLAKLGIGVHHAFVHRGLPRQKAT
jgi:hypothetical protein